MKRAAFIKGGAVAAGLLVILGIVIQWIGILCFDKGFYAREYAKLGTAASIGMSQEDLDAATQALLDYTRGAREDLSVTAEIRGERREVFNERETLHMIDVKALYLNAITVTRVLFMLGIAAFITLIIMKNTRRQALKGYHTGNLVFLGIIAVFGIYALIDFTSFWTSFHMIFFTNDLWLLYPYERLIQMVPEQFFSDLVARIVILFVICAGIPAGACAIVRARLKRKGTEDGVR